MLKFQRNYRAEFEIGDRNGQELIPTHKVTISYPFSCVFQLGLGINKGENHAAFQFINLSETDRADLWMDIWNIGKRYIYMKFYAGYGDTTPLIFEGFVKNCTSEKPEGGTEYITQVEAFDEGHLFQVGYLNATFTKGTTLAEILKVATAGIEGVKVGYVTPDILPLRRDRTYIGQTLDLLTREYQGYKFFINKGEINVLGDRDVVPGEVQVINADSGLLGSPERASSFVRCAMIFEPQLTPGQALVLQSYILPWLNQAYRVVRIEHKGIISPNVCGRLVSDITLTAFDDEYKELKKEVEYTYTGKSAEGQWKKPVKGSISSSFGSRTQPNKNASANHKGIDIAANLNSTVQAPANGKVIAAYISGSLTTGFGKFVAIDHGIINGKQVSSWYGHLNSWTVTSGQTVSAGDIIGYVGSTGNSTGTHLHFQINENNVPVNPIKYIGTYG